jgi:hypothetical protein
VHWFIAHRAEAQWTLKWQCMHKFPIVPPLIVKDTPKPRRLTTLEEARD